MDLFDLLNYDPSVEGPGGLQELQGPDGSQSQYGKCTVLLASGVLVLIGGGMIIAPTVSRVTKTLFKNCASKAFMMYSDTRSNYRWRLRLKTPDFARPTLDWVFNLSSSASVDSPRNTAESVEVVSATLKREDMCVDVGSLVEKRFKKGLSETGKVALYMNDLIPSKKNDSGLASEWSLEVLYVGHADASKRIPAQEFGVKYTAKAQAFILFPPYRATEKIKKGFTANKVLHARTFHEKDLTLLAKKYAGVNANFYKDVNDPHIHKFHVDHPEMHVLVSERGQAPSTIVVSRKE